VIPAISAGSIGKGGMSGLYVSHEVRERIVAALVDSGNTKRPGGTGERFDWAKMSGLADGIGVRLVVAGGLTAENVGEAIETLRPWGVDVASGVEARPGKKDPEKVRAFVRAVRVIDGKVS
jgi:phosphoribosylanthranilate isomerase